MAVLEYRDTDGQFKKLIIPGGGGGGTSNTEYLSDIKDVKIINPEKDQILAYDDTTKTWINKKNGAVAELPNNIAYITDSSETKEIKIRANQHNYSTEEQIIGTWVDGKPIYEKVIIIDNPPSGIDVLYSHGISNFNHVININVVYITNGGIEYSEPIYLNSNFARSCAIDSTNLYITTKGGNYIQLYVTIQYTKTTD